MYETQDQRIWRFTLKLLSETSKTEERRWWLDRQSTDLAMTTGGAVLTWVGLAGQGSIEEEELRKEESRRQKCRLRDFSDHKLLGVISSLLSSFFLVDFYCLFYWTQCNWWGKKKRNDGERKKRTRKKVDLLVGGSVKCVLDVFEFE